MSGILGIIHLDDEPIDLHQLRRMTDFMAFRGPDAREVWSEGRIGFGHTLLRTTWESEHERQPYAIAGATDGAERVRIVADARIDDRANLMAELGLPTAGTVEGSAIADVALILQAYLRWGEDCVTRLMGDFAFIIWDGRRQRLFGARDRFGVKQFYYSTIGNCLLISNTLDCLRQHPRVTARLNDAVVGDFLLFGMNYHLAATTLLDIHKLPAAHTVAIELGQAIQIAKYWTLPLPKQIRYRDDREYIAHFHELMGVAVKDRLRTDRVASSFSGGLDSTTIAATALAVANQQQRSLDLRAFSVVYDRLIPDRERYYAGLAATKLGIPIDYQVADDYGLYCGHAERTFPTSEPANNPHLLLGWDRLQRIAQHSRVVLCGHGGDEVFAHTTVVEMLQTMPLLDVIVDIGRSYLKFGVEPHWGSGFLTRIGRGQPFQSYLSGYPQWLAPDFERRAGLPARWQQIMEQIDLPVPPGLRGYERMTSPLWAAHLEGIDAGVTGMPIEVRMPFLDLRLVSYLLAVPPAPWRVRKMLVRKAMQEQLPAAVTLRPKSPLAGNPLVASGIAALDRAQVARMLPAIENYVASDRIFAPIDLQKAAELYRQFLPISFAYWFDGYLDVVKDSPMLLFNGLCDTS